MPIAPRSLWFTVLLGFFAALPALSIDLSAPTLVELPSALATTATTAGLTLSLFMVGFALGQLAGGRVSDRRGRRPVLIAALAVYALSGGACAFAWSGPILASGRLVQGASAGACAVLAFAMVQDLFQGEAARLRRSYVTFILGILPMLAPAMGAGLDATLGWRSVHAVLAAAGLVLFGVAVMAVGESRRGDRPDPFLPARIPARLREDRRFVAVSLVNALSYGTLFAYIAAAPVVVMGEMKQGPAVYAGVFACTALALSAGALSSAQFGKRRLSASALAGWGIMLQAVSMLALALDCHDGRYSPGLILLFLAVGSFARGLAAPNLNHLAVCDRHRDAGLASAAFGVVQLLGGAASSAAVATLLPHFGMMATAGLMAALASAAALLWLPLLRRAKPIGASGVESTRSAGN